MTIGSINETLQQVVDQPSRENILELAFQLLEWMGLESNKNKNPQLVAPKTQKLREYLTTAPNTTQPQLYRLNTENAPIRVRFAVLKRIKKDYVSQLVDNDPGADSFQSTPDALKPIVKAPYFIHFVSTPAYDRLVLIFNQGDQKRVITFRNKLTHTQYNKILEQWRGIASKSKPEIADLIWKSLDIKEVNKEFYRQIKERFDALFEIIKKQNISCIDNEIKQFSVRLIGRYIFCWFLKEKGIISPEILASKTIEKARGDFYQNNLLKLFFDTLNTKINDRPKGEQDNLFEKIPYLNGGLFDESEEDRLFRNVQLDFWLKPFVKILENYDFTVDESSSTYQQVAVDPEMLGRIFENLLASQNPETEKAANNERKAFGAFYTPREIVDYMVDEGLKTYLARQLNIEIDELASAFSANPTWSEKLNRRKQDAEVALQQIKILDPACGSGAFPMGALHRLVTLRELVSLQSNTYQLKKEILSNNIYGIDIMPMAVEIARLRTWLSLMVEEDYKGEKISSNFGIDALPNLDFKFMQGNSLLETYEGIRLFDDKLLETKTTDYKEETIRQTQKKIAELQQKFLSLHNENKLNASERILIEKEIKEHKSLITKLSKSGDSASEGGLFQEENSLNIAARLKGLHKALFGTSDKEQKKYIKNVIETLEWELVAKSLEETGKSEKLQDLGKLRKQNIKPYFLYKLNFPEVFTERGGFDLVIGNPPYVRQEAIDPQYKSWYIQNHPEVGSGTADLYVYFFDSALKIVSDGGIIIFITLNKFLKTKYGEGLRKKLKDKNVDKIIDFFELPVFEASTDTAITKIINEPDKNSTRYFPINSLDNLDLNIVTQKDGLKVVKDGSEWKFVEFASETIIEKIYRNSISLKTFTKDRIYRGLITGLNKAFVLSPDIAKQLQQTESAQLVKKFIKSTDITKYSLKNKESWLLVTGYDLNIKNDFPSAFKYLSQFQAELEKREDQGVNWWNLRPCKYYGEFENKKLVYIYTAKKQEFYLDDEGRFINNNCYMIVSDNKYLFFYLNSILFDWFKRIKFVAYGNADEGGRVKLDYNKMISIPIKQISEEKLKWFESKYEEINKSIKSDGKVKQLENEVELELFKLYGMTYEEVKIVNPSLSITNVEYERV